ncbi:hypothetical protein KSP40_PGU020185 [Platanthera guangdongensis]|uniref:Uncharacterized protein n=1 Tax=Platanthera guangdongensis TaxID=2320717 RepID=A0ABR2MFM6_9ASPA
MTSSSSSPIFLPSTRRPSPASNRKTEGHLLLSLLPITLSSRFPLHLCASSRYPNYAKQAVVVVPDPRSWVGDLGASDDGGDLDDGDDEEEEEDDDRSLDLLARLLQNMFQKISRQARKAVRSVLPPSISTKLVRFTVNGVLILAFLWLLKAFLEVACAVGSAVFTSILIVRGIWSGMSFLKDGRLNHMNTSNSSWNGVQPV